MTIKEIAKAAGVSPSTVSRVLNNPDYHCSDPALREKIWETAVKMNYTPNSAARDLKRGVRKSSIYFINILLTRSNETDTDPFFRELLRVISSEIHKNSAILSGVWYNPAFSDEHQSRSIQPAVKKMAAETKGKQDGLIIIGKCNPDALSCLSEYFGNIVSVNRNSTNYTVDEVLCDGEKIAQTAVEYLYSIGYRMIGYVGSCHHEARYRGYLNALSNHGLIPEPQFIFDTKQTETGGYDIMKHIIQSDSTPDAIYCANDITAIGMLKCLQRASWYHKVPAVIASDDIEEAQEITPMLTTVRLPREEMGKFAVSLLLDRIRGGHTSMTRIELEGKLIVRNSCPPADQSADHSRFRTENP